MCSAASRRAGKLCVLKRIEEGGIAPALQSSASNLVAGERRIVKCWSIQWGHARITQEESGCLYAGKGRAQREAGRGGRRRCGYFGVDLYVASSEESVMPRHCRFDEEGRRGSVSAKWAAQGLGGLLLAAPAWLSVGGGEAAEKQGRWRRKTDSTRQSCSGNRVSRRRGAWRRRCGHLHVTAVRRPALRAVLHQCGERRMSLIGRLRGPAAACDPLAAPVAGPLAHVDAAGE